jgi:hypothetical protein
MITWQSTRWFFVVVLLFLISTVVTSCSSQRILGKWQKVSSEFCALLHPSEIEFFDDGTYVGALPNWNGGKYTIVNGQRIKLDTTTGPGVYEFELSKRYLTFKNESNCEFRYRRVK